MSGEVKAQMKGDVGCGLCAPPMILLKRDAILAPRAIKCPRGRQQVQWLMVVGRRKGDDCCSSRLLGLGIHAGG